MILFALVSHPALAGERFLAWSYGADTVSMGSVELEPFSTVETRHEGGARIAAWDHEVELEYGITNAFEGGMYLTAAQTNDEALTLSGYKARVRYRLWPLGSRAVDLAGYLEYIGTPTFDQNGIEAKVILAHEGMTLRAALNLTGEFTFSEQGVEPVFEPTGGVAWRPDPHIALGIEGKLEAALANPTEGPLLWAGPTLHLSGEEGVVWWTVSAIFGLTAPTRDDAELEARSMVGIDL